MTPLNLQGAPIDLYALQAKAEAASKGPWEAVWGTEYGEMDSVLNHYPEGVREASGEWVVRFDDDYGTDQGANGDFIAALDPDTVLELIRLLRAATAALQNVHNDCRAQSGYVTTSVGGQVDSLLMQLGAFPLATDESRAASSSPVEGPAE